MKLASIFAWLRGKGTTAQPDPQPQPEAPRQPEPMPQPQPQPEPVPDAQPEPEPNEYTVKTYKATGMEHMLKNLLRLGIKNEAYSASKKDLIEDGLIGERVWEVEFYPCKAELVPEPDNAYDPNAIKVVVDGEHVAYIKKGSCKHLLKVIKTGRIQDIKCEIAGGKYKYISEDYDDNGREIYTVERGDVPYFVHLHITEKN